jgi:hypothetical protein
MGTFAVRWVEYVEYEVFVDADSAVDAERAAWEVEGSEGEVRSREVDSASIRVRPLVIARRL